MKTIGKLHTYPARENKKTMVGIGFECLDRELFRPEKCYDLLEQSGIGSARCQTGWAKCEKEPGVYDFAWLDAIVDALLSRSIRPWFNVGFGNPLYMKNAPNPTCVGCVPLLYGEETYAAWRRFLAALADHFAGRVTEFEIWNEPDIAQFWYPGAPDPTRYAALVRDAGEILRKRIPEAKIGACVSRIRLPFIQAVAEALPQGCLDFFSYHTYSMVPEENYLANVAQMRQVLASAGHPETELRQGEGGFPSWFPENHWLHPHAAGSERQQAVWQLRRYFLDAAAGVRHSSFFQMADLWEKPYEKAQEVLRKPAAQGILNGITYTPKKSYETITRLAAIFSGDVAPAPFWFTGRADDLSVTERISKLCLSYRINQNPVFAYYVPTDIQAETDPAALFDATISLPTGERELRDPVLVDPYTGLVSDLAEHTCRCGSLLLLTGLPIRDYPLLLCDRSAFRIDPL